MKRRKRLVLAVLTGLGLSAAVAWPACSAQRELQLVFWQDYTSGRGLNCVDDAGNRLVLRAANAGSVCILVDFLAVPSITGSLPEEILDLCGDGGCPPVGQRFCMSVPVDAGKQRQNPDAGLLAAGEVAAALQDAGVVVTLDAPHQQVVVRVTFTTSEGCPTDPTPNCPIPQDAGFPRCALVGCVLSAPFDPDVATGPITLDLDVDTPHCEQFVCAYAELGGPLEGICANPDSCDP